MCPLKSNSSCRRNATSFAVANVLFVVSGFTKVVSELSLSSSLNPPVACHLGLALRRLTISSLSRVR